MTGRACACEVASRGCDGALWTSQRWVSTLHRVLAVPGAPARQSLAFFHQPDWEAEIAPLDGRPGSDTRPPVRSGPYLMAKFRSAGAQALRPPPANRAIPLDPGPAPL